MAGLTRTQKYANLREQLSSSKEEKIVSEDLSSFQDRLNNVQDTLSPTQEVTPVIEEPVVVEPEQKEETNSNYIWNPFPDDVLNQPEKEIWEPVPELDQDNKYIQPVLEQQKLEEETAKESFFHKITGFGKKAEDVDEIKDVPAFEQPAFVGDNQETKKEDSYFDNFFNEKIEDNNQGSDSFNSYFEAQPETNVKQSIEDIYADVFDDVKDESGEYVTLKERDTYLNQTISDVNSYNINNGLKTIDQLVDNSVDAIRHPENEQLEEAELIEVPEENVAKDNAVEDVLAYETPAKEAPVYEETLVETPVEEQPIDNTFAWPAYSAQELDADKVEEPVVESTVDDEEFSNTVSMEISKIMEEISSVPEQESKAETLSEPLKNDDLAEAFQETIKIDEAINEEVAEDVVEIKNIAEMDAEPVKDTMSSTIPFVVAADDEEELEEDEEDGSNTVLNVILIVLIVVLVAVLGLIVFYILKTKGIF